MHTFVMMPADCVGSTQGGLIHALLSNRLDKQPVCVSETPQRWGSSRSHVGFLELEVTSLG